MRLLFLVDVFFELIMKKQTFDQWKNTYQLYGDYTKLVKRNRMHNFCKTTYKNLCSIWPKLDICIYILSIIVLMYIHLSWFIYFSADSREPKKSISYRPFSKGFYIFPPVFFKGGHIFWHSRKSTYIVGWFTKKTTNPPKKGKNMRNTEISKQSTQLLGVPAVDSGGFWSPSEGWISSSYLQDCSGWRFSSWSWTSCQRCSEGYSRGKPRNKPHGCRKGMGMMGMISGVEVGVSWVSWLGWVGCWFLAGWL